nr:cell surface hyaluronidase-like [Crassostrea gigas]
MDKSQAKPVIDVVDDVSSWNVGDKIFITSTDYDWRQVEEFTIETCLGCSTNQIQINKPPRFTHYGEIYKRVDMRAEVGPLTRNIHITSEVAESQTNGISK